MGKIRKYFGEFNLTWPKVIIFAVITAVYTALINQVDFLYDTSFRDIAINLECWFLFAIFIIVNCKKWWEASLKCFVFFLISQPLIFLIEVPFNPMGFGIFMYYGYWAKITLLTIPGGAIAFLLKKKNWLSVIVLSVATGYLAYACIDYFRSAQYDFPRHLISAIFCFVLALFFIFVLLDKKSHRIVSLVVFLMVLTATFFYTGRGNSVEIDLDEGKWTYAVEDDSIVKIKDVDENTFTVMSDGDGGTYVWFENDDGTKKTYYITVGGGNIFINTFDEE